MGDWRRARLCAASDRHAGVGAHCVERQQFAGHGLQIRIAGKIAGHRTATTFLRAGERTRSGTQQDFHRRSPVATARPEGKAEFVGRADGTTKKNAEQDAAHQVLEYLATVPVGIKWPLQAQRTNCSEPAMEVTEKHAQADTLSSLQSLLVTVVIAVFVITFIVQAFQIPSESMQNTLLIGDYLLVDKMRYGGGRLWDWLMPYRQVRRGRHHCFPLSRAPHPAFREAGGGRSRRPGAIDQPAGLRQRQAARGTLRALHLHPHDAFRDEFPRLNLPVPGWRAVGGWR